MIGLGSGALPRRRRGPAGARAHRRAPAASRARRSPTPCSADGEPRLVHHGEHAGHAAVLLADQEAGGAAVVAVAPWCRWASRGCRACARSSGRARRCARRASRPHSSRNFGTRNSEMPVVPGRRVRQPRQHQMDDVVGEVVLAVGDEDLLPGDAIAAVGRALGLGAQRADVGAGLRLGELHGARPFAGDELRQIGALELFGAVRGERVDRGHGQRPGRCRRPCRREFHISMQAALSAMRQVLAAPFGRRGEPVPAGRRPVAIGLLPARRRGDRRRP